MLEYLSRYTHRTAIGNQRIRVVNPDGVAFTVRAGDKGGKRLVRLAGVEFVRRFLLHVLPTGVKRIRHYGLLAAACKTVKLGQARARRQAGLRQAVVRIGAVPGLRKFRPQMDIAAPYFV